MDSPNRLIRIANRALPVLLSAAALAFAGAGPLHAQTAADPAVVALAPVPTGKLSDAARPTAYRLDLTLDPSRETFTGQAEIDTVLTRPSRHIDLHGRDLTMREAVARIGGRAIPARWHVVDDTGVARLTFDDALPAGPLTLAFAYEGKFNDGPAGLFRVKVGDSWYSWSQFQSIDARAAFPSFDEPGFKTPFTVTLRTPPGLVAVSNAPETGKGIENGLEVHRFAPTLPLPTYLMAMMVGPFAVVEGTVAPTPQRSAPLPLRIVSTKENGERLAFALDGSKGIVTLLESYFADAFPYPKLDQITSPIMPGAMENAGADLYEDSLLVMDDAAPTEQKRDFAQIVSHELAHQWFGDLVTPLWWDDIWLNESFANWMGFRIGSEWRPDLKMGVGALAEGFQAMRTDALVAGRAIHEPITESAKINAAFDTITYGKGGQVVGMIAGFMGDDKFRDGVRRYMKAHRYGSATSTDFFAAMAEAAGDPRILPAMQSFIDQQGVPLLTFAPAGGGRYTVTQSRYALLGTTAPETRWGVPLCLRRGEARQCTMVSENIGTIQVEGKGPLVPNAGGTGYYRFELPKADWDALIAQAARLPAGEALAVADSLQASFLAGRASAGQLVALARNLSRNPDGEAAAVAVNGLDMLAASGLLEGPADAAYRRFVGQLYRSQLPRDLSLRAGAYAGEDATVSARRSTVVTRMAVTVREPALRKRLAGAAAAWLRGDRAALDPQWYRLSFEAWLTDGGRPKAEQLLEAALASEDAVLRSAALAALGGSGNVDVARWLLDLKDERLRSSERRTLLERALASGGTRDMAYEWMVANIEPLMAANGGIFFAARLPGMLDDFCSAERADDFAARLRPVFAGQSGALNLERTIEQVRSCATLRTARAAEVSRELHNLQ
jgi:aminopeptidase N